MVKFMNRTRTKKLTYSVATENAIRIFQKHQGILKTNESRTFGIHSRTLYSMRDQGIIEQIGRGLFHLTESPSLSNIDLVTVAKQVQKGVICLISALDFYGLTTQIPHFVDIAYRRDWRAPKIEYPPIKIFRYSEVSYHLGIKYHLVDGISVAIYSPEKTIVDCFKFRNKIGLNVAIEALKNYWHQKKKFVKLTVMMTVFNGCQKLLIPHLLKIRKHTAV